METLKHFDLKPSIGGCFSFAWRKMYEKAFLTLFLAIVIVGLLNGPVGAIWKGDGNFGWHLLMLFPILIMGLAYAFLFLPVIKYGENYLFLQVMRDEEASLSTLFDGFKNQYLNIILANLIVTGMVIIGFVLLVIPGIIVACRLVFVPFLVMDKKLEPMKAIEKSWQLTKGYGWTVFFMAIISFFILIAGIIVFVVGVFISIMWIHSAFASLYQAVLNEKEDDNPLPILGVNEVK